MTVFFNEPLSSNLDMPRLANQIISTVLFQITTHSIQYDFQSSSFASIICLLRMSQSEILLQRTLLVVCIARMSNDLLNAFSGLKMSKGCDARHTIQMPYSQTDA